MSKIKIVNFNILSILYLELIFYFFIFKQFEISSIIYISLSSILAGLLITIISLFSIKKLNKIIHLGLFIFLNLVFLGQLVHYNFYESLFSIYSLTHGGQVAAFTYIIIKVILQNIIPFLLMMIPMLLLIIFNKKFNYDKDIKHIRNLAFIYLIISISYFGILNIKKNELYSAKNLYFNVNTSTLTSKKLGVLTTMKLDLERNIFTFSEKPLKTKEIIIENKEKYNILELNLDNTYDNNKINDINTYLKSVKPTKKNKYTGIFKDKNLIVITAESFSPLAIDEKLTPTLYKLYNEGFKFNNYYTPIYYTSTSDGEYMALTSLLPKEGIWSFQESNNKYFMYNYANIFKNLGYSANAYHNGSYNYYDRNLSHPNLGYEYVGCGNGLEDKINCDIWPQSDLELINTTIDDYINNDKFLAYYMSVSGHLNYTKKLNAMTNKNYELVKDLDYSKNVKGYIAANIEFDKAINKLLEKLKENNKLDDTVIVISGDHYPYGLTINELNEKNNYIKDEKFDKNKNILMIWNNSLKDEIIIDKPSSNIDVLPTVLNLFGIEYDSRLLIGKDILSESEGLVIFNDRSFITNKGRYDAIKDEFEPFKEQIDNKYIENIKQEVYNKFTISKLIFETNYYKHLK